MHVSKTVAAILWQQLQPPKYVKCFALNWILKDVTRGLTFLCCLFFTHRCEHVFLLLHVAVDTLQICGLVCNNLSVYMMCITKILWLNHNYPFESVWKQITPEQDSNQIKMFNLFWRDIINKNRTQYMFFHTYKETRSTLMLDTKAMSSYYAVKT